MIRTMALGGPSYNLAGFSTVSWGRIVTPLSVNGYITNGFALDTAGRF